MTFVYFHEDIKHPLPAENFLFRNSTHSKLAYWRRDKRKDLAYQFVNIPAVQRQQ